jgi:hypothetical protein
MRNMRCPAERLSPVDDDFFQKAGFGRGLRDERGGRAFVNRAACLREARSFASAKAGKRRGPAGFNPSRQSNIKR